MDKNINILLVDDKPENLLALESLLTRPGRTFFKAESGNEALKIVLRESIGLIMLDVQMPQMDGYEVAELLKSNPKTEDIPIIFLTAILKEEQYMLRGYKVGAVDYLYKPLDTKTTLAKVEVFETIYFQKEVLKDYIREIESLNKRLDKFVHIVSHDIKAPMGGIHSLIQFTKEEATAQRIDTVQEHLNLMSDQVVMVQEMIAGILAYSTSIRKAERKEEIAVRALIENIIQLLAPAASVQITIEGEMPVLFTEKLKLQQVFQNIISNAIKYNDKPAPKINIIASATQQGFLFKIADNGPGIAPENQQKVFELFATINPISKTESTGIGLSIVQTIVEDQGGRIWIESEQGQGASFLFEWMA